jgi:hypothetical protein
LQCSNMSLHAWEKWIESKETRKLLWQGKKRLKLAWLQDQKYPKSYPMNTWQALSEIQQNVSPPPIASKSATLPSPIYKKPRTLAELVPTASIKTIWEENHNGSFESAIIRAIPMGPNDQKKSWQAFQGIVRAIEIAYLVDYWGWELLPRPRVNILHRQLDKIAKAAGLGDQLDKGVAEFLDDLCPCGLRRHQESVRKSRSRSNRGRRQNRSIPRLNSGTLKRSPKETGPKARLEDS